jgi:hypothetical protein
LGRVGPGNDHFQLPERAEVVAVAGVIVLGFEVHQLQQRSIPAVKSDAQQPVLNGDDSGVPGALPERRASRRENGYADEAAKSQGQGPVEPVSQ